MARVSIFDLSTGDLTAMANSNKLVFLKAMLQEGVITDDQANEMAKYQISISSKGWFGKFFDKLMGRSESDGSSTIYCDVFKPIKLDSDEEE